MGTHYTRMMPRFWTQGTGFALRELPLHRLLFSFLFSNERAGMLGIYRISMAEICLCMGSSYPEADVIKMLSELADPKYDAAHYDVKELLVYVPGRSKHQLGDTMKPGDKQRVALVKMLEPYEHHAFGEAWWTRYAAGYHLGSIMPNGKVVGQMTLGLSSPAPVRAEHVDAPAEPTTKGRRGRAGRTLMRENWQPDPKSLAEVPAHLDVTAMLQDFRDYWMRGGEMMADWNAAWRINVRKILTTDWLNEKFTKRAPPTPPRGGGPTSARVPRMLHAPTRGPATAAPDDLMREMEGDLTGNALPDASHGAR